MLVWIFRENTLNDKCTCRQHSDIFPPLCRSPPDSWDWKSFFNKSKQYLRVPVLGSFVELEQDDLKRSCFCKSWSPSLQAECRVPYPRRCTFLGCSSWSWSPVSSLFTSSPVASSLNWAILIRFRNVDATWLVVEESTKDEDNRTEATFLLARRIFQIKFPLSLSPAGQK